MAGLIESILIKNAKQIDLKNKNIIFENDIEGKALLNKETSKFYDKKAIISEQDFEEIIVKCNVIIKKMANLKKCGWDIDELNTQLVTGVGNYMKQKNNETLGNRSSHSDSSCPKCGKAKKSWFPLCWECTEKEKQKPSCEICGTEVPEGHTLCKTHWKEKFDDKKKIQSIEYVKAKKESEFKEKFEGKYYFNSQKVKSKSELIICYFLTANGIPFQYEPLMTL